MIPKFKEYHAIKQVTDKLKATSLGIPREDMPQIFSGNVEDFKKFLDSQHIIHHQGMSSAHTLKTAQGEFNVEKVKNLMGLKDQLKKLIMITKDDYVLDGNHRVAAALVIKQPINYLKIEMNFKDLLAKIQEYDKVDYKSVKENANDKKVLQNTN